MKLNLESVMNFSIRNKGNCIFIYIYISALIVITIWEFLRVFFHIYIFNQKHVNEIIILNLSYNFCLSK